MDQKLWNRIRRFVGPMTYAWLEERTLTCLTNFDNSRRRWSTQIVRGVVSDRRSDSTYEIPFYISSGARLGVRRKVGERSFPAKDDIPLGLSGPSYGNQLEDPWSVILGILNGHGVRLPLEIFAIEHVTQRTWVINGEPISEPEEIWNVLDIYGASSSRCRWIQSISKGYLSPLRINDTVGRLRIESAGIERLQASPRHKQILMFRGQAAAVLSHELFGHYFEWLAQRSEENKDQMIVKPIGLIGGCEVTFDPSPADAIATYERDDLGRTLYSHNLIHEGVMDTRMQERLPLIRTGKFMVAEPWIGNFRLACKAAPLRLPKATPQRESHEESINFIQSAYFNRGDQRITIKFATDHHGSSRVSSISVRAIDLLRNLEIGPATTDMHHGVCLKGGLFYPYSISCQWMKLDLRLIQDLSWFSESR